MLFLLLFASLNRVTRLTFSSCREHRHILDRHSTDSCSPVSGSGTPLRRLATDQSNLRYLSVNSVGHQRVQTSQKITLPIRVLTHQNKSRSISFPVFRYQLCLPALPESAGRRQAGYPACSASNAINLYQHPPPFLAAVSWLLTPCSVARAKPGLRQGLKSSAGCRLQSCVPSASLRSTYLPTFVYPLAKLFQALTSFRTSKSTTPRWPQLLFASHIRKVPSTHHPAV